MRTRTYLLGLLVIASLFGACSAGNNPQPAQEGASDSPKSAISVGDIMCTVDVEVEQGDMLYGQVRDKALAVCPGTSYEDLLMSVPDANNIQPGTVTIYDRRGY